MTRARSTPARSRSSGARWKEKLRGGADRAAVAAEFAHGAAELPEANNATSRRSFVQLMGASAALAGLAACVRKPREQLLAYTKQPEGVVPGRALHYATATFLGGHATGLLATSYEGRPTSSTAARSTRVAWAERVRSTRARSCSSTIRSARRR